MSPNEPSTVAALQKRQAGFVAGTIQNTIATKWLATAATTMRVEDLVKSEGAGPRVRPARGVHGGSKDVHEAAHAEQQQWRDREAREDLRKPGHGGAADGDVAERHKAPGRVDPRGAHDDAGQGADPYEHQDGSAQGAGEDEDCQRRGAGGDEDEDRAVVEPAH